MIIEKKEQVHFDVNSLSEIPLPNKVLMVKPTHFNIDIPINAHMLDTNGKPHHLDKEKAKLQWLALKSAYEKIGLHVYVIDGAIGLPDMVFCANQSFPYISQNHELQACLSNMCNEIRHKEVEFIADFLRSQNYSVSHLLPRSEKTLFEGMGDALWLGRKKLILGGFGFRTSKNIYENLSRLTNTPVAVFELKNPKFYHLDTCLSILNFNTALVCKEAFTSQGIELLENLIPNLIEVPIQEADSPGFACNAHCPDEKHVLIQNGNTQSLVGLKKAGFIPIELDTSEFIKSGGSVFCMKIMFF